VTDVHGYRWYSATDKDGPRQKGHKRRAHAFMEGRTRALCCGNVTRDEAGVFWRLERDRNALRCQECVRAAARARLAEVVTS